MARVKRTSLNLDLDDLDGARAVLGTRTATETIHRALREVVDRDRRQRLAGWRPDEVGLQRIEAAGAPRFAAEDVQAAVTAARRRTRTR